MSNVFDQRAQSAPQSGSQQGNYDNWNQMVGSAPPDQVRQATSNAVRQIDPQDYYRHTQPGVDGTDPLGSLPRTQLTGLVQAILSQLMQRGLSQSQISDQSGLKNLNPSQMSPHDAAALAQWTHMNHPDALGGVAEQFRNEPDLLEKILGNKALWLAAAGLGAFLYNQSQHKNQKAPPTQSGHTM